MRNFFPIFKKELASYFTSPIAYVVYCMFLIIVGYLFYSGISFFSILSFQSLNNPNLAQGLNVTEGVFRPLYLNMGVILLLMMPLLTMRLFAEEKKSGTIELLLTNPIRDVEVLLGKYAACMAVYVIMLLLTALFPVFTTLVGSPEAGPILSSYFGLLLLGASFVAIGTLVSSLTENQIIAAAVTFGILLLLWVISWSASFAGPVWGTFLLHLSATEHFQNFAKGVLDTQDIIYYLNLSVFCLFLTLRSLESKRWRG